MGIRLTGGWAKAAILTIFGPATALCSAPGTAQDIEYPSAIKTFQRICLMPGVVPADRLAAMGSEAGWIEDPAVTFDILKIGISKAIERNYAFDKVANARQWSGDIDGHRAHFILATFAGKQRYENLCALMLDGPRNAMSYSSELKTAFKTFGIGGKSVDLVHYFEFAGKVGPDKHPVRGEIFTRSLSGSSKQTTHIYVAY
jgi:hypothetical protein